MSIRQWLHSAMALVIGAAICAAPARADTNPRKPIHLVIGFAAGGGTDVFVRLLAPYLSAALGQPVPVENRTGANGNLATEAVARAAPDGYTLLVSTNSVMGSGPYAYPGQPVDPIADLAHITMLVESPWYVVGSKGIAQNSMAAVLEAARAAPKKFVFGSQGRGSMGDIIASMIQVEGDVQFNIVQYRGGGAVVTDILANQAQLSNFSSQMMDSYYSSQQVNGLMVLAKERNPVTPDIPSSAELGLPNLDRITYWVDLRAPKATPPRGDRAHLSRRRDSV
jgi:tripartite-type tricarboxylate transporter receptor subunit TctC